MSSLTYTTTCSLCGQQFAHNSFVSMIETSPALAIKVMDALRLHMAEKHQKEDAAAQIAAQAFLGLLRTQHYTSQDESAMKLRDYQRWQIFEMVKKSSVPDSKIVEQVSSFVEKL